MILTSKDNRHITQETIHKALCKYPALANDYIWIRYKAQTDLSRAEKDTKQFVQDVQNLVENMVEIIAVTNNYRTKLFSYSILFDLYSFLMTTVLTKDVHKVCENVLKYYEEYHQYCISILPILTYEMLIPIKQKEYRVSKMYYNGPINLMIEDKINNICNADNAKSLLKKPIIQLYEKILVLYENFYNKAKREVVMSRSSDYHKNHIINDGSNLVVPTLYYIKMQLANMYRELDDKPTAIKYHHLAWEDLKNLEHYQTPALIPLWQMFTSQVKYMNLDEKWLKDIVSSINRLIHSSFITLDDKLKTYHCLWQIYVGYINEQNISSILKPCLTTYLTYHKYLKTIIHLIPGDPGTIQLYRHITVYIEWLITNIVEKTTKSIDLCIKTYKEVLKLYENEPIEQTAKYFFAEILIIINLSIAQLLMTNNLQAEALTYYIAAFKHLIEHESPVVDLLFMAQEMEKGIREINPKHPLLTEIAITITRLKECTFDYNH